MLPGVLLCEGPGHERDRGRSIKYPKAIQIKSNGGAATTEVTYYQSFFFNLKLKLICKSSSPTLVYRPAMVDCLPRGANHQLVGRRWCLY